MSLLNVEVCGQIVNASSGETIYLQKRIQMPYAPTEGSKIVVGQTVKVPLCVEELAWLTPKDTICVEVACTSLRVSDSEFADLAVYLQSTDGWQVQVECD